MGLKRACTQATGTPVFQPQTLVLVTLQSFGTFNPGLAGDWIHVTSFNKPVGAGVAIDHYNEMTGEVFRHATLPCLVCLIRQQTMA